jgi:transcriptional regulator GlxA family with amidase domain
MRAHLRVFLVECARAGAQQMPPIDGRASRTDQRIALVLHELDRDPTAPPELPALARRHGLATGSLCRAFKRYTGMTILAYQQRARILLAQAELSAGERGIADIALACGFDDVRFFQRVFRRVTGTTPSRWREKQR